MKSQKDEKMNQMQLKCSLQENIQMFKDIFKKDETIVFKTFQNKLLIHAKCCIIYIDGMVDSDLINKYIIGPILSNDLKEGLSKDDLLEEFKEKVILSNNIKVLTDMNLIVGAILSGDTALLLDGENSLLAISSQGWKTRNIEEPLTEMALRGPREGFNESVIANVSLIRRKLKTSDFKVVFRELGARTHTKIAICYLQELANPKILKELQERLNKIEIDGILDSGYIQELIKDSPLTPFKTIGNTEKPDAVAGKLLEGRIAVVVDGSPSVLTLPFVYQEYFQASEDYYNNYYFATINRLIRVISMIFSTSVPAVYVALMTFHQEMIPSALLLSIAAARKDVPFPTIVEAIGMLFVFEVLRESSMRMPSNMGQTIGIVGALVLGTAVVEARLISAPIVIVVALTGITGMIIPKMKGPNITTRIVFLVLAAYLGLYGLIFGVIGILLLLFGMRSFGVPYMLNYDSFNAQDLKDMYIRSPWWYMQSRPHRIGKNIGKRQPSTKQKGKSHESG